MCGLAGWVDFRRDMNPEDAEQARRMARAVACRGPDDEGVWLGRHAALGHRRLVVVDRAGGRQPMVWSDGAQTFVLLYNGELYNTPELRRELAGLGWEFQGYGDTETLLAAFVQWGRRCLERLNGIFAFAVWQQPHERLFLARDRLGVKPLFYAPRAGGLVFGSELKALLAHPWVPPELDEEGLNEVLVMGPGRSPGHGVFRGVFEVRPGHWVEFDRHGLRQGAYWELQSAVHTDDAPTTALRVRELLEDSVRRQLVSDVPICTMLSGGIDSSAITALACRALGEQGKGPLLTFSVDYEDNQAFFRPSEFVPHDDRPWTDLVSATLGTVHRRVVLHHVELAEALRGALRARDLPGMADVDSSLYLFCRAIREHATVALSGECADEVFAGYPWFRRPEDLAAPTFPWVRNVESRLNLYSPELVAKLSPREYLLARYRQALSEVPRLEGEPPAEARLREVQYLTITRFMPVLLDRMDRMSMAFGLEVRVPFCDHRLLQYVWNIPWPLKRWEGQEKGILRLALQGLLPPAVLQRRKSPYPKTHHPDYLRVVREWILDILRDPHAPLAQLVDRQALRRFACEQVESLTLPWFGQLMTGPQLLAYLAQVDTWMREYRVQLRL
ncbi:MAG TPA: asparagine synthase (glutamine-hydrolyzing) [Limnochordales bacterium]